MKLRALRLHNVKRFAGRGIAIEGIGDGVNVLTAANEYGKSTCFEALHALFFQPHSGTPGSVQMLRPYSGGNPLVEADIETDDGRFRLTKQFYGGRSARVTDLSSGRLIAQADEAEQFIAGLTRGGAGGPAGLLWVRQGLTGLEKRSKSEEEGDRRVRESLLTSVQGEVEALTGGRRMQEITNACEEALQKYVTATMRPKAGGPYAEAIEERDTLADRERQLAGDVRALRDALDRRQQAVRTLKELEAPEAIESRRAALADAEEAHLAARSQGETLKAAEADLRLAEDRHKRAGAALAAFEAAAARAEQVQQRLGTAVAALAEARTRRGTMLAENDHLQAEVLAAEEAERQARADKDRLDAAIASREAAERLAVASKRLADAEALRNHIEATEARLATLVVPDDVLKRLEALDIELLRLRAAQSAGRPTVRMVYRDPAYPRVLQGDRPLPHDSEQSFTGTLALDVEGVGQLTIRSQHVDDTGEAIAGNEAKSRTLLAGLGVASLAAARQRQGVARTLTDTLALDRQLLGQLVPDGIERLRAEVVRLAAVSDQALEIKFDPQAISDALTQAMGRVTAARMAVHELRPALAAAEQDQIDTQAKLAGLEAEHAALESALGAVAERPLRLEQLRGDVAACATALEAAVAQIEPLRASTQTLFAAEASLKRARAVAQGANQKIAESREILAELNGQIHTQADRAVEETWQETRELLTAAEDRVRRYETEVKTLDRLRKALATARTSARDLYLKPVISELLPLLGLLFDDISITFNEETLLPESVRRGGLEEDVDRLSGGMREQLSVLTRLAFARLLANDGHAAPVILDDALVYSDDDRIERMFEALHSRSQDLQILVFSCRQRAFSALGGKEMRMQDWRPD